MLEVGDNMKKKKLINLFIIIFIVFILIIVLFISIRKITYKIDYETKVDNIMADTVEIEKKYLIDKENIQFDLSNAEITKI